MLQVFLNEKSFEDAACDRSIAKSRLKALTSAIRAISAISPQFVLNGSCSLAEVSLSGNWTLAAIRNDYDCVDESVYLKTIQDRFPFGQAITELKGEAFQELEYRIPADAARSAGADAIGLGLAHYFDRLALSLTSHAFWEPPAISLTKSALNSAGDVEEHAVQAKNAATADGIIHHSEALVSLRAIESGSQLWEERTALFPHLEFIPRTRDQIEGLGHGHSWLAPVFEKLLGLEAAVAAWHRQETAYPVYPFGVNGESRTRRALTAFQDSSGVVHYFEDHAKFTPDEGRVHFLLFSEPQRLALIGHVGRKLGIG